MAKKSPASWIDHIGKVRNDVKDLDVPALTDVQELLDDQTMPGIFYHCVPMMYVLDYTRGKYIGTTDTSEEVLGHKKSQFMDGGLNFLMEYYHPDDMKLFNNRIFPDRVKALQRIPPKEHPNYIFTFNFRMRTQRGNYVNLLQRNCFVSDAQGLPIMSIGMVANVEHYANPNPVIQVLEKKGGGHGPVLVEKKIYYTHDEDLVFTKREKEILAWTAEGFTSKEIGEKLFLSSNTVINHRKNMMEKAGVKNLPELVAHAIRHQII